MTINTSNLEIQISKNISSSNTQQLLSYSKAAFRLKNGIIGHANSYFELPDPSLVSGVLYFVNDTNSTWQSNGSAWSSAFTKSTTNSAVNWSMAFLGNCQTPFTYSATGNLDCGASSPLVPYTGNDVKCVSLSDYNCGGCSMLMLKNDSTLWAVGCGMNYGASGTKVENFTCSIPVQEISQSKWIDVFLSRTNAAAIKTDGSIWTWGYNNSGALGHNGQDNSGGSGYGSTSSPVREITSTSSWCLVTGGYQGFSAMKTSGQIWSWGRNQCGSLGDGTTTNRSSPVREVSNSTNWCHLSGHFLNRVGLKTDGTLWSWGSAVSGILADNQTLTSRCSPVQEISGSTNWKMAWLGGREQTEQQTWALKTDGTLWTWGNGNLGSLGDGCTADKSSPVQEAFCATDWCFAKGTGYGSFAVKTDGSLWYTGYILNKGKVLWGCPKNVDCTLMFINTDGFRPNNWICIEPNKGDCIFVGFRR